MAQASRHFGLEQWRNSRFARAVAAAAALSFLFLLSPFCDDANAAGVAPLVQKAPHATGQAPDHQVPDDTCPSLDHTSVVQADTVVAPAGEVPATPLPVHVADTRAFDGAGAQGVVPRATPPPRKPFPLYLRYAHLRI